MSDREVHWSGKAPRLDLPDFEPGTVWLAGAGPGDPGLLTLLTVHGLSHADIVLHDALVNEACLGFVRPGAVLEYVGKRGGKCSPKQGTITQRMIELARRGQRVLRLKGGDPFIFGRGGEEALALAEARIRFRVLPGVSAGTGGLAYAGVPITHRSAAQAVTFLTGHGADGRLPNAIDWPSLAKGSPVIVLFMGKRHLGEVADRLIAGGRNPSEPVVIVENASLGSQQVLPTTLAEAPRALGAADLSGPAIICIGPVAAMHETLNWFEADGAQPETAQDRRAPEALVTRAAVPKASISRS
ncbi:MAG: uroporphyrinogen-III C-methyltransferase [Pseudomonadota bacterium]